MAKTLKTSTEHWADAETSLKRFDLVGALGSVALWSVANLNPMTLVRGAWQKAKRKG